MSCVPNGAELLPGHVRLVGAGLGDAALLTLRAAAALGATDVALHDALPGPTVLSRVRPCARRVDVGKRKGAHHGTQAAINGRLSAEARAGRRVVRLKGGDPFVLGRGGEEAMTVRDGGALGCRRRRWW